MFFYVLSCVFLCVFVLLRFCIIFMIITNIKIIFLYFYNFFIYSVYSATLRQPPTHSHPSMQPQPLGSTGGSPRREAGGVSGDHPGHPEVRGHAKRDTLHSRPPTAPRANRGVTRATQSGGGRPRRNAGRGGGGGRVFHPGV